ncbi:MAG: DUF5640 domain-containing protein [Clostridia bacterium]|nr:DUF5640 domain-containing protein [Clostridia bacterium]
MQKQVFRAILLVLLLVAVVGLSACKISHPKEATASGRAAQTDAKNEISLVGSWIPSDSENASMQYDFSADGTLKITLTQDHVIDASWELDGNTLSVSSADTVQKYEIAVSGDRLTFIYENGTTAEWVRK